jgi:hypothetical protein
MLLERTVGSNSIKDLTGCYPLFVCADWAGIATDLRNLSDEFVSVVLVTDPFGSYDEAKLTQCFPDLALPFKHHFVRDLRIPETHDIAAHHMRNIRKGLRNVDVQISSNPMDWLDEWCGLYDLLTARHGIKGISRFSPTSFAAQFTVPGLVALRAAHNGETVGMALFFEQPPVAYYHLAAYSLAGYGMRAAYALFWRAIEHFRSRRLQWLSLGASPRPSGPDDGLTRFKSGWATGTRIAYLCGRILNSMVYDRLLEQRAVTKGVPYFPAYRYVPD